MIPISDKGFNCLAVFQNDWLRRCVGAKSWTPTTVISVMLKQLPIKIQIYLQMASLFHNIWCSDTPLKKLCIFILEDKKLSKIENLWIN